MATIHKVYVTGEINYDKVAAFCAGIDKGNDDESIDRIQVIISSGGGRLGAGFAMYDYVRLSKKPIDTIALGWCGSVAVNLLQAGSKRYATPSTTFMIHPSSYTTSDAPHESFLLDVENHNQMHATFVSIVAARAGIAISEYEQLYSPKKFLTPNDALGFGTHGLIDAVLSDVHTD